MANCISIDIKLTFTWTYAVQTCVVQGSPVHTKPFGDFKIQLLIMRRHKERRSITECLKNTITEI